MQQSLRRSWLYLLQAWRASLLLQICSVSGVWYASFHGAPFFRRWKNKQGEELGRTEFFEKQTRTNIQVPAVAFTIHNRDKLPFYSPKLSFPSRGFVHEHLTSTSDNVFPRKCATQERWAIECGKAHLLDKTLAAPCAQAPGEPVVKEPYWPPAGKWLKACPRWQTAELENLKSPVICRPACSGFSYGWSGYALSEDVFPCRNHCRH